MTTFEKQNAGASSLRYLDLSFEGRRRALTAVPNNGFRPHGGHRGTKRHPPSTLTFNKPAEYHHQLQADVDRHMEEAYISENTSPSPAWVYDVTKEPMHTPESPLFHKQLLAPNKTEQQKGGRTNRALHRPSHSAPTSRAASANSQYRPNRTHQYLGTTEVKDSVQSENDCKYGRPTRTTLLRARQRCNSAPVNSYHARREAQRKAEEKSETKKAMLSNISLTVRDVLQMRSKDVNSMHSFLTGARYNRAHYVDAKSLHEYGVYTSRSNPQNSFVLRNKSPELMEDTPHAPAVTPQSAGSTGSTPNRSQTPSPTSTPQSGQAWAGAEQPAMEVSIDPVVTTTSGGGDKDASSSSHVINLNDGLNIKGMGYQSRRPRSGKTTNHHPHTAQQPQRPAARSTGLPSVYIQGTAIWRTSSAAPPQAAARPARNGVGDIGAAVLISQCAPPPSPSRRKGALTVRDIHQRLNAESSSAEPVVSPGEHEDGGPLKVSVVNKAVDVPSTEGTESVCVSSPSPATGGTEPAVTDDEEMPPAPAQPAEEDKNSFLIPDDNRSTHSLTMEDDRSKSPVPIIKSRCQSAKTRGSRVRFADQLTSGSVASADFSNHATATDDSVNFFLTEDSDETDEQTGEDSNAMKADRAETQPMVYANPFSIVKPSNADDVNSGTSMDSSQCLTEDKSQPLTDTDTSSCKPGYTVLVTSDNIITDENSGAGDSMIVDKGSSEPTGSESGEEQPPLVRVIGVDICTKASFSPGAGFGDR